MYSKVMPYLAVAVIFGGSYQASSQTTGNTTTTTTTGSMITTCDNGSWKCPQSDKTINCEYVCDGYEPADCGNGADEDTDFCAVWNGGGDDDEPSDDDDGGDDDEPSGDDGAHEAACACSHCTFMGDRECKSAGDCIVNNYELSEYGVDSCDELAADTYGENGECQAGQSYGFKYTCVPANDDGDEPSADDDADDGDSGTCEKQGDVGSWTCPGSTDEINCDYVCDDYEPADCDNGEDEDADFCAVWNGGGDDDEPSGDDDDGDEPSADDDADDGGSGTCEKKGDVGSWTCPGSTDDVDCDYVCDGYEPPDCGNGADEDTDFCAVWNGGGDDGDDFLVGDDLYGAYQVDDDADDGGSGTCEKKGDVGQWQCPQSNKTISCEYVCDDYEPADCDNGEDEDADFCAMWKGGGDDDPEDDVVNDGVDDDDLSGTCEKKGDVGQWKCPQSDKAINCGYVCDDYAPADCDNGEDEDADFCTMWNGGFTSTTKTTTTTTTTTYVPGSCEVAGCGTRIPQSDCNDTITDHGDFAREHCPLLCGMHCSTSTSTRTSRTDTTTSTTTTSTATSNTDTSTTTRTTTTSTATTTTYKRQNCNGVLESDVCGVRVHMADCKLHGDLGELARSACQVMCGITCTTTSTTITTATTTTPTSTTSVTTTSKTATTTTRTTTTYAPKPCNEVHEASGCGTRVPKTDCEIYGSHGDFAREHCPTLCELPCTSTSTTTQTTTTTATPTTTTTTTKTMTTVTATTTTNEADAAEAALIASAIAAAASGKGDDADSNSTWYYIGGAMGAAILVLNIVVVILGAKSCKKQDTVAMLAGNQAYVNPLYEENRTSVKFQEPPAVEEQHYTDVAATPRGVAGVSETVMSGREQQHHSVPVTSHEEMLDC